MLVQFENDIDVTIYVVARNVTYIAPCGDHDSPTLINLVGGGSIKVKQDREEVAKRLRNALAGEMTDA